MNSEAHSGAGLTDFWRGGFCLFFKWGQNGQQQGELPLLGRWNSQKRKFTLLSIPFKVLTYTSFTWNKAFCGCDSHLALLPMLSWSFPANSGININCSLCQSVANQPLYSALWTGPCQTTRQNCQSGTHLQPHARKIRMRPQWEQIKQLSMCYI